MVGGDVKLAYREHTYPNVLGIHTTGHRIRIRGIIIVKCGTDTATTMVTVEINYRGNTATDDRQTCARIPTAIFFGSKSGPK